MKKHKKLISWVLVIFVMAIIFYLSHKPAVYSNKLSKGITKDVIIDSAGAFVGIVSYNLIYRIKERS